MQLWCDITSMRHWIAPSRQTMYWATFSGRFYEKLAMIKMTVKSMMTDVTRLVSIPNLGFFRTGLILSNIAFPVLHIQLFRAH